MSRHVLVPIDGAEQSYAGLEYCFASFPNATLTALHVVDPSHDNYASVGDSDTPEKRAEARGEQFLERAIDLADDHGHEIKTELRTGRPHSEILSVASEDDIDHLVLGSHGRSPIRSPFLGRVSEAVVRRSPVSTTIVPETPPAIRDRDLPGRILVAVDGSEQAEAAVAYAVEAFPDASHTLLNVIDLPLDHDRADVEGTYLDKIRTAHESSAEEILESAAAVAAERGGDVETATVYGTPAAEIVDYADGEGYDQIIMGSHGRSLAARLVTGSVAERVTRDSPQTVTLIRGEPGAV
ncbi:universal stress protein [Natronorubrum sp. JWXQ-INN-674]|uniref:Universal stress protein n=1 Tax=Natronorubrum halalkaliphilum TaxID=2691917 RepID=A0A6B0VS86_9EURY|nr:universal stress protein [Natronorubrum halalkaliphilum]MXV63917.1 universal stress protein [Natronorubrum halalkaliphilum]